MWQCLQVRLSAMFRLRFFYPDLPIKFPLLIIGTNLGGFGTLIASMASLISYESDCTGRNRTKRKVFFDFYNLKCYFLVDSSWSMEDDRGTVEISMEEGSVKAMRKHALIVGPRRVEKVR